MGSFVLDCSVAISWLMPDEMKGAHFLQKVVREGAIVPTLWPIEVGNFLLMAERKKRITPEQRFKALFLLDELPITIDHMLVQNAWLEAFELANEYGLTLYDACYLEVALRHSMPLVTYDEELKIAAQQAGVPQLSL